MNRSNLVTTRTGLTIGGHYVPPAPPQSRDADAVQAALLGQEASAFEHALDWLDRYSLHILFGMAVVGLLIGLLGRLLWR